MRQTVSQPEYKPKPEMSQENDAFAASVDSEKVGCSKDLYGPAQKPTKISSQPIVKPQMPQPFRPREAQNMSFSEKITSWLSTIPWFQRQDGVWVLDCFPGHVASSQSGSDDLKSILDHLDIFEHQARRITKIVTSNYMNNGEVCARPSSYSLEFSYRQCTDEEDIYQYANLAGLNDEDLDDF